MIHAPIRLIIVDDHQMVRETWRLILEQQERFQVIGECSSGAEAIEAACKERPDVMLMDINMSPVNGFEATRKICKLCPDIKIIGVSVNNQVGYARNMLQLGAKGYVTKNCAQSEMIDAILEVYNGRIFLCQEIKDKMNPNSL